MPFNSFGFYLLFIVLFLLYWRIQPKWQTWCLLLASYYFYFSSQAAVGLVLVAATLLSFGIAQMMERQPKRKKMWLTTGIVILLGLLGTFKYLDFFSVTTTELFRLIGLALELPTFSLLLPLGISFFTFQTVGYLIDVYRGTTPATKQLGRYALFVSFFPTITAGPIERSTNLLQQLATPKKFEYQRVVSGAQLFALGLFKKVVIADNLALAVNQVFANLPEYKGLSLVLAIFLFSWQLYADFSGYTDMARGVARMLGFNILENFRQPYLATSVRDFWRRWHISLSSWFRDYLYIPLGGNRVSFVRGLMNTMIVFLVCGLWHGAALTFVAWGALHGIYLAVERVVAAIWPKKLHVPAFLGIFYTYPLILASWVVFRAENLSDALYIYRYSLSGLSNIIHPEYVWASISQIFKTNTWEISLAVAAVVILGSIDLVRERFALGAAIRRLPMIVRWSLYITILLAIVLLQNFKVTEFIYVRF